MSTAQESYSKSPRPLRVSAFTDDALGTDDATALAAAIQQGQVHPDELVEAAIARARQVDPHLNAIVHETFEQARSVSADASKSRFGGLPTFIKDTDAAAGAPLTMGSRAFGARPKSKNSPFVDQLLATGLVSLGKTALPEFGLTATTESAAYGPTRNPWNTDHSTGGSSGGSAALVAAGVVPIAHANDGGGSIRIPAACCGLVGLKPSRGRLVPPDGAHLLPVDIVVQGVVTRSVRDTAAFVEAAEAYRANPRLRPVGRVEGPGTEPLRVATFTADPRGSDSHPACSAAVSDAAKACEELGHHVEEIPCPFEENLVGDFFLYWGLLPYSLRFMGKSLFGKEFDRSRLEEWTQRLAREFGRNLYRAPAVVWRLRKFARTYEKLFERYDVLVCPTLAQPPVEIGYIGPDVPFETAVERVLDYAPFTPIQNVSGAPAISLPLARAEGGLPIGVQFAGPFGSERRLLELAFALEEARPWPLLSEGTE